MSWKKILNAIIWAPVTAGILVVFGIIIFPKLPSLFCRRFRCVRFLSLLGFVYDGLFIALYCVVFGFAWWEVLFLSAYFVVLGDWLLPDPIRFLFAPQKRKAVIRAIEHVERESEVNYRSVDILRVEPRRIIVSLLSRRGNFVAVTDDGNIMEMNYNDVVEKYGLKRPTIHDFKQTGKYTCGRSM